MAAVSRGTSYVTTKQRCKYTASVAVQNALCKATVTNSELHTTRALSLCSEAENITIEKASDYIKRSSLHKTISLQKNDQPTEKVYNKTTSLHKSNQST